MLKERRMRSFLECWSRSLNKRVPRFSFCMMSLIGMNNMELWRSGGTAATAKNRHIPPNFFAIFSELFRIFLIFLVKIHRFLVLSNALLKSNPYVSTTKYWRFRLLTFVIPKENLGTLFWRLLFKNIGWLENDRIRPSPSYFILVSCYPWGYCCPCFNKSSFKYVFLCRTTRYWERSTKVQI